jgi:dTDP-4-dehydrorhamnose 3,5-epimerase-like enzyme
LKIIKLKTVSDERGSLSVIEQCLNFDFKRVYYIYGANGQRGGHAHKKTKQALVAVNGRCNVDVYIDGCFTKVELNDPALCLLLDPEDFHYMDDFSKDCVLLVLASEFYDKSDYIYKMDI